MPFTAGRTIEGKVTDTIAIVIGKKRNVATSPELLNNRLIAQTSQLIPRAI